VFQIAAHERVIPLEELYGMCRTARDILRGPHEVGRVIARPFEGEPGKFVRTPNRKDYAIPPPHGMLLDRLAAEQVSIYSIGKISDIFLQRGISRYVKTKNNADGMQKTEDAMRDQEDGLIFVNLVDFDQQFGHRNDVEGYAGALEAVDRWLPKLELKNSDAVILTADHGCDPTTPSTDHSREYTPLLVYGTGIQEGVNLGTRATLADIGQTVAENFGTAIQAGTSFLSDVQKRDI
jgi:phosphopentomutase